MKRKPIPAKVKVDTSTLFIRNITKDSKKKFYDKAAALGYLPRELFELMIKKL